jgi:hypothetical protein
LGALVALIWLNTGCSGVNASHSVSPASFFLPGLMQVKPPPPPEPPPAPTPEPTLLAHAR